MRRSTDTNEREDLALAEAAARLLDGIKAEPVPERILVLAQQLQNVIDSRRRGNGVDS